MRRRARARGGPVLWRVAGLALAVLSAGAGLAACNRGAWLDALGVTSFEELGAGEAQARLDAGARLVQIGAPPDALPDAELLPPGAPVPAGWLAAPRPVVVVASDPREGRAFAARLARAGIQGVVVVDGGLPAWEQQELLAGQAAGESGG